MYVQRVKLVIIQTIVLYLSQVCVGSKTLAVTLIQGAENAPKTSWNKSEIVNSPKLNSSAESMSQCYKMLYESKM